MAGCIRWDDLAVNDYGDRLDPATYVDDPIVVVYRAEPAGGLDVPERVFWRLTHVAMAYQLHLLPLLGGSDPVPLNKQMIQMLIDELNFIADRLNDPVAEIWIPRILEAAQSALWQRGDAQLTIEGE